MADFKISSLQMSALGADWEGSPPCVRGSAPDARAPTHALSPAALSQMLLYSCGLFAPARGWNSLERQSLPTDLEVRCFSLNGTENGSFS